MDEPREVLEFSALLESAVLSGDVRLFLEAEGLRCDTLLDSLTVDYADLSRVTWENYALFLGTPEGTLRLTRLGQSGEWAYEKLQSALAARVLDVMQVTGEPQMTARARYELDGGPGEAEAELRLYPDGLCLLPPNRDARRFPLALFTGLEEESYALTLTLSTGERCRLSRLGREQEPLRDRLSAQVRAARESAAAFALRLCEGLGRADAARAAGQLREYVAAPLSALPPPLARELEKKLRNSKMKESYGALAALCEAKRMAVGVHELPVETVEQLKAALLEKLNANGDGPEALTPEQEDSLRWALWVAAPAAKGGAAVVEFALPDEDAATYVFACDDFDAFLPRLNRALEATRLQRELLTLSDGELAAPSHAAERIILDRTPALRALRKSFLGRAAHRSLSSWQKSVSALTERPAPPPSRSAPGRFCTQCGAPLAPDVRFCGQCGARLEAVPAEKTLR